MNIMLIVVALIMLFQVQSGYKKGMVKEVISLISLLLVGTMIALLACVLHTYMHKEIIGLLLAIILLTVLGVVHKLLKVVFFSIKTIAELPVVSLLNKLLGAILGLAEVIFVLQLIYFWVSTFGMGSLGEKIVSYTMETPFLSFFYEHNWIVDFLNHLAEAIGSSVAA